MDFPEGPRQGGTDRQEPQRGPKKRPTEGELAGPPREARTRQQKEAQVPGKDRATKTNWKM